MQILHRNEIVTLVDRTLQGHGEIMVDGQPVILEEETPVHREFVEWLYRYDKARVWTTDGRWEHRYAVENPPQWLIDRCGAEVGDTSPIEVDTTRLEGWNTDGVERSKVRMLPINISPSDLRERQGAGAHAGVGKR